MHVTCIIPETESILSSKMTYSVDSTITILAKLVTYKSFCPDNYSKCYYNHYMEKLAKNPGISKMMQEVHQKYYLPSIATYVRNWVRDCEICTPDKRMKKHSNQSRNIPHPRMGSGTGKSHANRPIARTTAKWGLQKYHYSNRCIFKYAFAYPVSNPMALNAAKVIIDIMTRHA